MSERAPSLVFLGCGQAARMHAGTLRSLFPEARIAFASRDGARAEDFRRRHGGQAAYGAYEAALADPRVQIAVVVTPPSSHLEWTLAALAAGKHVIVEKPAFPRSADFAEVEAAARASGRQVLVAENYHYKPIAEALRTVVREERIGRVVALDINALKRQRAEGWRTQPALAGGGALLEGGIHWISLLAHLGLDVEHVEAVLPERGWRGERDVRNADPAEGDVSPLPELSALVTLRYRGGAVASLAYSWEVPSLPGGLRISRVQGTDGTATFESNGVFLATSGRSWSFRFPGLRDLLGYRSMFTDFLNALEQGRAPRFTLDDAKQDVEIVEAAYRSAGRAPTSDRVEGAEWSG